LFSKAREGPWTSFPCPFVLFTVIYLKEKPREGFPNDRIKNAFELQ